MNVIKIDKILRSRLKEARIDIGLTQVQVSKRLKKAQSFVAKIEGGMRKLSAVELLLLAKMYKKPVQWFFKIRRKK